jgi:hypothetical protein
MPDVRKRCGAAKKCVNSGSGAGRKLAVPASEQCPKCDVPLCGKECLAEHAGKNCPVCTGMLIASSLFTSSDVCSAEVHVALVQHTESAFPVVLHRRSAERL